MKKQPTLKTSARSLLFEILFAFRSSILNALLSRLKSTPSSVKGNLRILNAIPKIYRHSGVVFRYSKEKQLYSVHEDGTVHYFENAYRGASLYSKGITGRCQQIANSYLLNDISFCTADVVIDCGANYGDLCRYFQTKQPAVRLLAYEPSPSAFRALDANLKDSPSFHAHMKALGPEVGEIEFYLAPETGDCSAVKFSQTAEVEIVEVSTLDVELDSFDKIRLLKVEAEGFEPEILSGAIKVLKKTDYITVDCGPERGESQATTVREVTTILSTHGFFVCNVDMRYSRGRRLLFKKLESELD